MMNSVQKCLVSIYSGVNRTAILETEPAKALFKAAYFAYKRYLEDPFWKLSRRHPKVFGTGDFCDVGANVGYTVRCFAPLLFPASRLYAFEPERRNFSQLQQEINSNPNASQILAIQAAVGAEEGMLSLWVNPKHHADHRLLEGGLLDALKNKGTKVTAQETPVITLDRELIDRQGRKQISFVKIDVQGFELPVFEGMRRILELCSDRICIAWEYAPDMIREAGFDPQSLIQFWQGWNMYGISLDGNLVPLSGLESIHAFLGDKGYGDLLTTKRNLTLE